MTDTDKPIETALQGEVANDCIRALQTQVSICQLLLARPTFPDQEGLSALEGMLDGAREMVAMVRTVAGIPTVDES